MKELKVLQKHIDSAKRLRKLDLGRGGKPGYVPSACCPIALAGLEFDPRIESWGVATDIVEDQDAAHYWALDFDENKDVKPVSFKLKEDWEGYL